MSFDLSSVKFNIFLNFSILAFKDLKKRHLQSFHWYLYWDAVTNGHALQKLLSNTSFQYTVNFILSHSKKSSKNKIKINHKKNITPRRIYGNTQKTNTLFIYNWKRHKVVCKYDHTHTHLYTEKRFLLIINILLKHTHFIHKIHSYIQTFEWG